MLESVRDIVMLLLGYITTRKVRYGSSGERPAKLRQINLQFRKISACTAKRNPCSRRLCQFRKKKLVPTDVPNDYNESGLAGNISSGILSALLFGATSAAGIIALAFVTAIFASFISSIFSGYAFVALIFSPDLGGYCSYLVKPFFGFINVIKPFLPLAITTLIGIGFLLGMGGRSHEKSEKIKANNRKETILENNRQKTLLLEDLNASEAKNLNKLDAKNL